MELTVDRSRSVARVGEGEPFPFNFEHLAFVAFGMAYQAWGAGSHFIFRNEDGRYSAEFQGPRDRSPALCYLSEAEFRAILEELKPRTVEKMRAHML